MMVASGARSACAHEIADLDGGRADAARIGARIVQ